MSDFDRTCQRAGCRQSATVTLSFRYDARQASLVDLVPDKDPSEYDLCDHHAEVLIVPRGWERLDRRTPRTPVIEHAAFDGGAGGGAAAERRFDRYAALTAQLPRLAEAAGVVPHEDGPATAPSPVRPAPQRPEASTHPFAPVTRTLLPDDVLDGQLQMPIEHEARGVVVALTRRDS